MKPLHVPEAIPGVSIVDMHFQEAVNEQDREQHLLCVELQLALRGKKKKG